MEERSSVLFSQFDDHWIKRTAKNGDSHSRHMNLVTLVNWTAA